MSILQGKRKRQDLASTLSASMTNEERMIYNIIRGKKEMGIWQGDIKRETNIPDSILKKSIKLLISKTLIKEVVNIQNKSKKVLMAMEFEPSKEITGGEWYTEGRLDTQLIDALSDVCLKLISRKKIATRDAILEWTRTLGSEVFPGGVSPGQVEQILKVLVMENKLQEVNSTGFGDFSSVPAGEVCFRLAKKVGTNVKVGAMASIPCGVCPRIQFCTPNGGFPTITSPQAATSCSLGSYRLACLPQRPQSSQNDKMEFLSFPLLFAYSYRSSSINPPSAVSHLILQSTCWAMVKSWLDVQVDLEITGSHSQGELIYIWICIEVKSHGRFCGGLGEEATLRFVCVVEAHLAWFLVPWLHMDRERAMEFLSFQVGRASLALTEEQKIKLSIARALLLNPSILLLDEVTGGLDFETERLSLIKNADYIAVMEDGQLVEMGTHDELLTLDGLYAVLLRREEATKLPKRFVTTSNHGSTFAMHFFVFVKNIT
ncbi:hypothetical protein V8G54_000431 [Vigna mungo]|uniref:DNA-directed RNA polymerase III subunit RPC6 n=1 Tax=Vigna mungo TaxID=3915 RepID=A0AAQ3S8Y8_VIGMU